MYIIYKFISILIYPYIRLLLLKRVKNEKEDELRYKEKLGYYKEFRPKGKLIWFHAASIGEFNAILPIIRALSIDYPAINILVTTVTITAAKIAANNLPKNAIHQFAPLDCYNIVQRFLNFWKPDLVIWTESEFWPNMIVSAKKIAPLLLINARLSEKSYRKWKYIPYLAKFILSKFSLILAQNKETKVFIEALGVKNIIESGNLKFIAENFTFDNKEVDSLKEQLAGRVVLMAASTHPGEEEMFIRLQQNLQQYNLFTIIAPRHPNRKEEVVSLLSTAKLNYITRSSGKVIGQNVNVLLLDTLGEFGLFYRLSNIVCVGGSWKKIGHNFIEAAKLKNLIIFGSNMDNSREVSDDFLNKAAALNANNIEEIEAIVKDYLLKPESFEKIQAMAEKTVDEMNQVKSFVLDHIKPYIEKL